MPQPTISQVHIDAILTNISVAYMQMADAFIADWGRAHGVSIDNASSAAALSHWMSEHGPEYFGLPFHADAAIADHVRLTGDARGLPQGGAS